MGALATLPTFASGTPYTHTDFNAAFAALTLAAGAVGTNELATGAVTLGKIQNLAQYQLLGRNTAGSGAPELVSATATGYALLAAADAPAARGTLGVRIGTDVQAYAALLAAFAGLASAADTLPYCNGVNSAALTAFTAYARTLVAAADAATARGTLGLGSMAQNTLAYLETTATAVNQTGTGTGVGMVFNTPGAPTIQLSAGKWLVIGTVAARMSDVAGAAGFRLSNNAGTQFFGAGSAPYLPTTRGNVTVVGYKNVPSGTFDVYFYGIPNAGSTINLGEATGIAYAGTFTAVKLEGP